MRLSEGLLAPLGEPRYSKDKLIPVVVELANIGRKALATQPGYGMSGTPPVNQVEWVRINKFSSKIIESPVVDINGINFRGSWNWSTQPKPQEDDYDKPTKKIPLSRRFVLNSGEKLVTINYIEQPDGLISSGSIIANDGQKHYVDSVTAVKIARDLIADLVSRVYKEQSPELTLTDDLLAA